MTILRRATEQNQSEWIPCPEGLWRWMLEKPELKFSEQFGKWEVKFPLLLTPTEQQRLKAEYETPSDGVQQSWRATYKTGLSLGYMKEGAYVSTKLIDFLAACLGSQNVKKFRDWVSSGGGPGRPADRDDDVAEMEMIRSWLGWWEGLELYGSIRHEPDRKQPGVMWARFGGPMPVGSLPGQKDPDYQALALGKLRAMLSELHPELAQPAMPVAAANRPRTYNEVFGDNGDPDDLPF